jgi:hypothetical protein
LGDFIFPIQFVNVRLGSSTMRIVFEKSLDYVIDYVILGYTLHLNSANGAFL